VIGSGNANDLTPQALAPQAAPRAKGWAARAYDLTKLTVLRQARRPPPPAGNFFVDYVDAGFRRDGFGIGQFTAAVVWAAVPPRTSQATTSITITAIIAITGITCITFVIHHPDRHTVTVPNSAAMAARPKRTRGRRRRLQRHPRERTGRRGKQALSLVKVWAHWDITQTCH
jgi:hypothetical protein